MSEATDRLVKHLGYDPGGLGDEEKKQLVADSQKRLAGVRIVFDDRLAASQAVALKLARAITKDLTPAMMQLPMHAAIIPPASDRVRTAGMYSRRTREVYIAADQLKSARNTVDVLIHELAHHLSGAEDLEPALSQCMTRLAARVVQLADAREFDGLLKEVAW